MNIDNYLENFIFLFANRKHHFVEIKKFWDICNVVFQIRSFKNFKFSLKCDANCDNGSE